MRCLPSPHGRLRDVDPTARRARHRGRSRRPCRRGACAGRGLRTGLVDPQPDRPFTATYGCWADELPPGLPDSAVAARAHGRAVAHRTHDLGWQYVVFDVPALRAHLDEGLADVAVHAARTSAEQTAFGVVVPAVVAAPLVPPGEALFMDWRADHGEGGWPTFLYGIPVGAGEVLLEETSLARRPGLPVTVLRRRLHARLAHHGIPIPPDARTETVRFPVDRPRHDVPGVLGFGAAAPLVHPATGFSLAAALGLAEPVADRARGAAADAAGRGARVLRRLLRPARGPALGLPHRSRRPVRHGRHDNGALSGVRVAVASAARRSGGAAPAARQRRAGRAVTYTPVSTLRTLPSGSSNHALLTSS